MASPGQLPQLLAQLEAKLQEIEKEASRIARQKRLQSIKNVQASVVDKTGDALKLVAMLREEMPGQPQEGGGGSFGAFAAIEGEAPAAEDDGAAGQTIGAFFSQLGQGMIDTQRDLDKASERYLQETRQKSFITPTVFRMPKVSGSLKVGLRREGSRKLNLLIFGNKSEEENHTEQNIEFEMVAAPAPVEALQELAVVFPGLSLVLDPEVRAETLALAHQHAAELDGEMRTSMLQALAESKLVLIFAVTGTTRGNAWLLVASPAKSNAQSTLGAWLLDEKAKSGAAHLNTLFYCTDMNQFTLARQIFNGLRNRQKKLFDQAG